MESPGSFQEHLEKSLATLTQEQLVERIKKCQNVVDKLESDEIWRVVLNDADMWVRRLNGQWQNVYDEKQLANLRVLKLAYNHLSDLPKKYKTDLQFAQLELDRRQNTDSEIQKDYDLETNMEST